MRNRHEYPLPKEKCKIYVKKEDFDGKKVYLCEWHPFDEKNYTEANMPSKGYLGYAKVIEGRSKGIGFNVWEQNDSEFVEYQILN